MVNFEKTGEHGAGTEHEYSKIPEDNGWNHIIGLIAERYPEKSGLFEELGRNKTKKEVIEKALLLKGLEWNNLLSENTPRASYALGQMLAHWDSSTDEQNKEKAEKFAELQYKVI